MKTMMWVVSPTQCLDWDNADPCVAAAATLREFLQKLCSLTTINNISHNNNNNNNWTEMHAMMKPTTL